jgi:hypothetical protein
MVDGFLTNQNLPIGEKGKNRVSAISLPAGRQVRLCGEP